MNKKKSFDTCKHIIYKLIVKECQHMIVGIEMALYIYCHSNNIAKKNLDSDIINCLRQGVISDKLSFLYHALHNEDKLEICRFFFEINIDPKKFRIKVDCMMEIIIFIFRIIFGELIRSKLALNNQKIYIESLKSQIKYILNNRKEYIMKQIHFCKKCDNKYNKKLGYTFKLG